MKTQRLVTKITFPPAAALLLALGLMPCGAATPPAATTPPSAAATNAAPAIPQSLFEASLPSGRDPFFPRSSRRNIEVTAAKGSATASDPTNLALQGLSHSSKRPMATINNQSFSPGEEGEVVTSSGRMRIRCEEIKQESVVISIGGSRLELRMPQRN